MSIKLTIGTAVYNVGEAFLRMHIEGILKQLTDETELLLIDDCSTDNSGEVCREYAEKDGRIRYIRMDKNSGLSSVRNRTIDEAKGKWIFFADGDDLLSDYAVETALRFYDTDYDVIMHNRGDFVEEKPAETACTVKELTKIPESAGREISISCLSIKPFDYAKYNMDKIAFFHAAWAALYRRDFLTENKLIFPVGQKKAQDSVFNTYTYFTAKNIAYLPYKMYYYRKNASGITKRYSRDFVDMAQMLIGHHMDCIKKLYPDDAEVKKAYSDYRLMSLTLDAMKLKFFHKDNTEPKAVRKKEFLEFVESEPFKSAISDYKISKNDWWGWNLPILYVKKKNFTMLNFAIRHEKTFEIYGKAWSAIHKIF